ncbi:O-antigen ligase family protein [Microbacterium karelineae]|uniref:O-antigen ligase family protein n=1 Tax=Microbacterium karelineae TaxID=2654283 RepID=UPI0018D321AE|nr:O-antigen ligase family protein [Microbacterium karelineae]
MRQAASTPVGIVYPLAVMLPLTLGFSTYALLPGGVGGATIQKALILFAFLIVAALLGVRMPPMPVWVIGGVIVAAYVLGLITQAREISGIDTEMLLGAAGLLYPWLAFFIDWRRVAPEWRAMSLAVMPAGAVVVSVLLGGTGVVDMTIIREEYTGAFRLSAGMPSAYLAGLALIGVMGAAWLWARGRWVGPYLALLNCAIVALTGTRVATLAAGLVLAGALVLALIRKLPQRIPALALSVVGLIGALVVLLPNFLQRTRESGRGGLFDGSGRDQAWSYFWSRLLEHPWAGFGPGSSPLLAGESSNHVVRESFLSPHNTYLTMAADMGIPLAIVFFFALGWTVWGVWRRAGGSERWVVLLACSAALIYAYFDNLLTAPQSAVAFVMFLAMMGAGARVGTPDQDSEGDASVLSPGSRREESRDLLAGRKGSPRREWRDRREAEGTTAE